MAAPIPASVLQEMTRAVASKADTDTRRLLQSHPGLLDAPLDASGRTALMFSAHNGRCNPLRALLAQGAPVDSRSASGATAAWYAASNNKPTALRILLRHGADPGAFVTERDGKTRTLSDVATEKRHAEVLEVLSSFLVALHLHKCRRLIDDFNVLIAQDEAERRRQQQEQQQQEEEQQSEADVETQSIDGEQGEEGDEEDDDEAAAAAETGSTADSEGTLEPPDPPPMPRPNYLRLRPGQGAEGMPRVEIRSRDDLRAWVEIYEDGEDDDTIRAKRRRRKRRAGGLRAGAELECARGAFEYVLCRMGPALYREFMELMG